MEFKQQVPDTPSTLSCIFHDLCSGSCQICMTKGFYYLVSKLYLPKTLIPRAYYFLDVKDLNLSAEAVEIIPYLSNIYGLVNEGKGFYAYSTETGTGKTSLGCIALKYYLYHSVRADPYDTDNRRVLYLNIPEFLDRIRKSFNREDLELEALLDELTDLSRAPKLILFDDLGAEKPSEWVRERLYTLINFRVSNNLASLYTSNESPERLTNSIGKRIVSRIEGSTRVVLFGGRDKRQASW